MSNSRTMLAQQHLQEGIKSTYAEFSDPNAVLTPADIQSYKDEVAAYKKLYGTTSFGGVDYALTAASGGYDTTNPNKGSGDNTADQGLSVTDQNLIGAMMQKSFDVAYSINKTGKVTDEDRADQQFVHRLVVDSDTGNKSNDDDPVAKKKADWTWYYVAGGLGVVAVVALVAMQ